MENETANSHMLMMKELSEIKSSLAVNTNETSNIKARVAEIQADGKEALQAIKIQNGRVRTLEDWSTDAKKIIENTAKTANETHADYKVDKVRLWTAMAVILFLGGTIIALSIMAIDSKIREGINTAFDERFDSTEIINQK